MSIDLKATGENIKWIRKKKGISIKTIQDALGFGTPQSIYKWQRGESLPSLDNLVILSKILDESIDNIIILKKD